MASPTRIVRVEIHEFAAPVRGLGAERSNPLAITNIVADPSGGVVGVVNWVAPAAAQGGGR